MLDFDKTLKLIAVIGGLLIGYFWSGGIWNVTYIAEDDILVRTNKLTGGAEVTVNAQSGWITVGKK